MTYEEHVVLTLSAFEQEMLERPGMLARVSKGAQKKLSQLMPSKLTDMLTGTIKGLVKTVLFSLEYLPQAPPKLRGTLEERDAGAVALLSRYKKIAAAEGAGTGAGGIVLGLVDFPALIAIKFRFLFELAHVYGYDTNRYEERLFLLHLFQLAFSSQEVRPAVYERIKYWDSGLPGLPSRDHTDVDWAQFQQEYRDAIDLRKMLQMVPGIGAVVGAWANYGLLEDLGRVAINCFRMRRLAHTDIQQ